MCALGAVYEGSGRLSSAILSVTDGLAETDAIMALRRAVDCEQIHEWNDAKGRTNEQVLAAFDRAIVETAPARERELVLA